MRDGAPVIKLMMRSSVPLIFPLRPFPFYPLRLFPSAVVYGSMTTVVPIGTAS